jgi:hypothetical protein
MTMASTTHGVPHISIVVEQRSDVLLRGVQIKD